jgi:hypothetical protein
MPVLDATASFPLMVTHRMSRLQKRNGWLFLALMGTAQERRPYAAALCIRKSIRRFPERRGADLRVPDEFTAVEGANGV